VKTQSSSPRIAATLTLLTLIVASIAALTTTSAGTPPPQASLFIAQNAYGEHEEAASPNSVNFHRNAPDANEQLEDEQTLVAPMSEQQQMIQTQGAVSDKNDDSRVPEGRAERSSERGDENNTLAASIGNIVLYGTIATIIGVVGYTALRLIKVKQRRSAILKNNGSRNNGSPAVGGSGSG
jgi:hypothetical protein